MLKSILTKILTLAATLHFGSSVTDDAERVSLTRQHNK
jgi:hypothetical protein